MIFAFRDGEAATLVLGQPNLTTGTVHTTRTGMSDPSDVVVDSSGNVWVADNTNARVLEFVHPVKTGQAASLVLGQSSFTTRTMATSKTGLSDASGIALDSSGNVWVADAGNNRVLEFVKGTGFKNGRDLHPLCWVSQVTPPMHPQRARRACMVLLTSLSTRLVTSG